MSASDHLSPQQFYKKELANYTEKVHPTSVGLPFRERDRAGTKWSKGDHREIDVPLHQVHAEQDWVYKAHVKNLAAIPAESFHEIHAVPEVIEHHEGHYLINEGTHRAAAAHQRGDQTLRVRVTGRLDQAGVHTTT